MSTPNAASPAGSAPQGHAAPAGGFDHLFDRYRGAILIEYLRALRAAINHQSTPTRSN